MKTISMLVSITVFVAAVLVSACGPSSAEIERMRLDSLRKDSIAKAELLLKIDTCTAYFRRHTWADKKHMVTFDRIEILSDSAAREYAKERHGFDGRKHIVINLETTTATMAVTNETEIWIVNPDFNTGKSKTEYIRGTVSDVESLVYNSIISIATQNKNILWLKQLNIQL